MGILLDNKYWADVVNRLDQLTPKLGETITKDAAKQIRSIACEALTKLTTDPDFQKDLAHAIDLGMKATVIDDPTIPGFPKFLEEFMLQENKILGDSNVKTTAARDLQSEIHRTAMNKDQPKNRFDRLDAKIAFCAKLACDPTIPEDPKKLSLFAVALKAVKGVAVIGMDVGTAAAAAITLGPAGAAATGTVAGISAGYGAGMIVDAVKGRW
jgi:hypothetical protein